MMRGKPVPHGKRRRDGRRPPSPLPNKEITRGMLTKLVRPQGRSYAIAAPSMGANDIVIRGQVENYRFHSGLRVHATDTLEAHDLDTVTDISPELTVIVFLEGTVSMELDDHRFELGSPTGPAAHLWSTAEAARSRRLSKKGTRIRKVLVSAPHDWFHRFLNEDAAGAIPIRNFIGTHRSMFDWTPSNRVLALCEQILNPSDAPLVVQRLEVESKAIEIFASALSSLAGAATPMEGPDATLRHITRARAIRGYIIDHAGENIDLTQVARSVGMSVESMQRSFKSAYGTTVVDFIREYRLHQARRAICEEGISISEAAYRAGYSSPANFSTAFKKLFGLTPSEAAK